MLPFLGILCVVFGLVLCLYYFILICRRNPDCDHGLCVEENHAFEIVKLVEALREVCPPGSGRGWILLPAVSVSRCWRKTLPFEFLGSKIHIHACSAVMNASATAILNVVADIYTWSDWEPYAQQRHLEAEISDDPDLHGDRFMQCDQVITMMGPGQNPKPGILMHRFGNLEANGVGWVLMWHIRQLDWCFYLSQPIEEPNSVESNRCLLTLVRGVSPFLKPKEDIPGQLACRLSHLRQALETSNLQIRPFLPIIPMPRCSLDNPHLPTIRSALYDTSDIPCVLLKPGPESKDSQNFNDLPDFKTKNHLLAVVPFAVKKPVTLRTLKGFVLVPWPNQKDTVSRSADRRSPDATDRVRRRAVRPSMLGLQENGDASGAGLPFPPPCASLPSFPSSSSSSPATDSKNHKGFVYSEQRSSFFGNLFRRRSSDASSNEGSSGARLKAKSLRRNSSSALLVSLLQKTAASIDELDFANHNKDDLRSCYPEEQLSEQGYDEEHNNNISEEAEMSLYLPILPKRIGDTIDYDSVGRECIARVLMEVKRASAIDLSVPPHEQKKITGGWVCEGIHKDVLVLMKMNTIGPVRTVSYLSKGIIPATPEMVWKTICNPLTKYMYDETCKRVSVIEELTKEQRIVYTLHESVSLLKKEVQDFCLLLTERLEGAHNILSLHSVEHLQCPHVKDATRGMLLPSGWIVEPYPDNDGRSVVTYLIQLTVKTCDSLLIEEMGTTQCISKLRRYFGSRIAALADVNNKLQQKQRST